MPVHCPETKELRKEKEKSRDSGGCLCGSLFSCLYHSSVGPVLGNIGKPWGFRSRLENMKKAWFRLFLFIVLGQWQSIEQISDMRQYLTLQQMLCIKGSPIMNSDMHMYVCTYVLSQGDRAKDVLGVFQNILCPVTPLDAGTCSSLLPLPFGYVASSSTRQLKCHFLCHTLEWQWIRW